MPQPAVTLNSNSPSMAEKRLELVRGLGPSASTAIVVGTMIGTGIFLKPAEMAREGRFVSIVFAAWIVGAVLSIFGALSYAELGAAIPEAGGEYAYLRRGFSPVWGFLFGWMHSIVGRPSSAASISAGMMRFLSFFFPALAVPLFTVHIAIPGITRWIPPYDFQFTWAQPFAVFWILVITGINYLGVRLGGGALDDAERANDRDRHAVLADAKILPRPLRLGTPIAVGRNFDWAETVGLGACGTGTGLGRPGHQLPPRACLSDHSSVPIPKFALLRGTLVYELRNRKHTSKSIILVRLLVLKSAQRTRRDSDADL